MNDRFKFRAWNKKYKKWTHFDFGDVFLKIFDIELEDIDFFKDKIYQSTGLKDKNDKLIYEGDVVSQHFVNVDEETKTFIAEVMFGKFLYEEETNYGFYINTKEEVRRNFSSLIDCIDLYNHEIIGNIYENPELIKEEKK